MTTENTVRPIPVAGQQFVERIPRYPPSRVIIKRVTDKRIFYTKPDSHNSSFELSIAIWKFEQNLDEAEYWEPVPEEPQDYSDHEEGGKWPGAIETPAEEIDSTSTDEKLWQVLTKNVCGRDMSGLTYYKEDLIKGLRELLK